MESQDNDCTSIVQNYEFTFSSLWRIWKDISEKVMGREEFKRFLKNDFKNNSRKKEMSLEMLQYEHEIHNRNKTGETRHF